MSERFQGGCAKLYVDRLVVPKSVDHGFPQILRQALQGFLYSVCKLLLLDRWEHVN